MPVLTVLTDPTAPSLTEGTIAEAAGMHRGLDHGPVRWLSDGAAAQVAVEHTGRLPEDVWARWQERGVDLVLHPEQPRRRRVLLADMDSTMIGQECIDELAAHAGVGERVADITARAMNGELDFEDALRERVGLLRGLPSSVIDTVLQERITLAPGGATLVATVTAHGGYAALVSGGFTHFTGAVAQRLGFDEHRANTLSEVDGRLTGEVVDPVVGKEAKVAALHDVVARLGLNPGDVAAVGDGANDLPMLQLAGLGVALHAKPAVARQVSTRVNHADLTAVLYLQGYSDEEIVRP